MALFRLDVRRLPTFVGEGGHQRSEFGGFMGAETTRRSGTVRNIKGIFFRLLFQKIEQDVKTVARHTFNSCPYGAKSVL
jgi:hypothetical protein